MSAPIPLRRDLGASQLRGLAKKTKDGPRPDVHGRAKQGASGMN